MRRSSVHADPLDGVKRMLHDRLLSRVDARQLGAVEPSERRLRVREEALAILREERHILPTEALSRVVNEVSDRVVGLGAIEPLLRDPEVSEVMGSWARSACESTSRARMWTPDCRTEVGFTSSCRLFRSAVPS
jgi:hypothetical protein